MTKPPPNPKRSESGEPLVEGRDYTVEKGLFVFTRDYLLRRGHCCASGCRHCPYTPKHGGAGRDGKSSK